MRAALGLVAQDRRGIVVIEPIPDAVRIEARGQHVRAVAHLRPLRLREEDRQQPRGRVPVRRLRRGRRALGDAHAKRVDVGPVAVEGHLQQRLGGARPGAVADVEDDERIARHDVDEAGHPAQRRARDDRIGEVRVGSVASARLIHRSPAGCGSPNGTTFGFENVPDSRSEIL